MKIDSFEIKHNQYLCVVLSKGKRKHHITFNLRSYNTVISINDTKNIVQLFNSHRDALNETIEADFDLSPIVDAFMLANLEK